MTAEKLIEMLQQVPGETQVMLMNTDDHAEPIVFNIEKYIWSSAEDYGDDDLPDRFIELCPPRRNYHEAL